MISSIIAVLIVIFALLFISGCRKRQPEASTTPTPPPVTVQQVESLSRSELLKMLNKVESQEAPEPKMGAMCYKTVGPPSTVEYICPECGEKTVYTDDSRYFVSRGLQQCRKEISQITKSSELDVSLDESSYCRKCEPDVKKPLLVLVVKYDDGTSQKTSNVNSSDLRMLRNFLEGKLSFESFNDGRSPLKNHLKRIRELLGIKGDK